VSAVLALTGCGDNKSGGTNARESAAARYFANLNDPTNVYAASCDSEPQLGIDGPVYACDLWHNSTDDGWYCVAFDSSNDVMAFDKAAIVDTCG